MLGELLKDFSDFGVVRRGLFFANAVPKVFPNFVEQLSKFAARSQKRKRAVDRDTLDLDNGEDIKILASNLTTLFPDARKTEFDLWRELHEQSLEEDGHALGAVLISRKTNCQVCKKLLHVKSSRISEVVVYDEVKGTFLASKISKICLNKDCQCTQHYGYYTVGDDKFYDEDWYDNEYFLSTSRTAFSIDLLRKLEIEIVISKMSFKEKAEIYNAVNGFQPEVANSSEFNSRNGSRYVHKNSGTRRDSRVCH